MQCRLKIEMTKRRRSQKPLGRRYVGKCQVAYNKPSAATNHIYLFAGHKEKKLLCQKQQQQHRSAIETIISKKMKIKNSISLANDLSI